MCNFNVKEYFLVCQAIKNVTQYASKTYPYINYHQLNIFNFRVQIYRKISCGLLTDHNTMYYLLTHTFEKELSTPLFLSDYELPLSLPMGARCTVVPLTSA